MDDDGDIIMDNACPMEELIHEDEMEGYLLAKQPMSGNTYEEVVDATISSAFASNRQDPDGNKF